MAEAGQLGGKRDLGILVSGKLAEAVVLDFPFADSLRKRYGGDFQPQLLRGASRPMELRPDTPPTELQRGFREQLRESKPDLVIVSCEEELARSDLGSATWDGPWQEILASRLVGALKTATQAHVLAFNAATHAPSTADGARAPQLGLHRFDAELIRQSMEHGISIVDVDRALAELGMDAHVPALLEVSPQGLQGICALLLDVLADIGFFEERALLPQLGARARR